MGIRVFQQPNGQFAVYSSIVEDFLVEDADEEDVREWYIERQKQQAEDKIEQMLEGAREGNHLANGPTSYAEAVNRKKELG